MSKGAIQQLACSCALFLAATMAAAAEPAIALELNKLEPKGGGCRAYFIIKNRSDRRFTRFKTDLVIFDPKGIVARRMAVDFHPLRARKTTVKLFDIDGVKCSEINKVLVNDVLECAVQGAGDVDCLAILETRSLAGAALFK